MLKHKAEQISVGVKVLDILICVFAFIAAYYFRGSVVPTLPGQLGKVGNMGGIESLSWLLATSLVLHLAIYPYLTFYASIRQRTLGSLVLITLQAFAIEFFVLGAMVFFLQEKGTSRYFFVLFLCLNYALLMASRVSAWVLLSATRYRGYNFRQVLIVGLGQNAKNVHHAILENPRWGYVVCGFLSSGRDGEASLFPPEKCIGTLEQLEQIVRRQTVDEILFALDYIDGKALAKSNALCHDLGIPARFSLSFFEEPNLNVRLSITQNIPFVSFYRSASSPLEALVKRSIDILFALVGLLLTGFLLPIFALKIKRQSPGPVLFSQLRVGENGRVFRCYKFRTMRVDADSLRAELAKQNEMQGPMFKVREDPRIFPFGAFLRKTSLDELPQFWNVLIGEMSLVGTRPPLQEEVSQYELDQRRRLSIKPGMTGLWQVSGRSNIQHFKEVVMLDLYYIDNWSLWLDFKIILKTIRVVLLREGSA